MMTRFLMRSSGKPALAAVALAAILMLAGCAYKSTTTFTLQNASTQVITVRTVESGDEKEFTVDPGRRRDLVSESTKCPENYIPIDRYGDGQILPPANLLGKLEIWVNGKQLPEDVCVHEMWSYFNTDYTERFTLVITDQIIESFLGQE